MIKLGKIGLMHPEVVPIYKVCVCVLTLAFLIIGPLIITNMGVPAFSSRFFKALLFGEINGVIFLTLFMEVLGRLLWRHGESKF